MGLMIMFINVENYNSIYDTADDLRILNQYLVCCKYLIKARKSTFLVRWCMHNNSWNNTLNVLKYIKKDKNPLCCIIIRLQPTVSTHKCILIQSWTVTAISGKGNSEISLFVETVGSKLILIQQCGFLAFLICIIMYILTCFIFLHWSLYCSFKSINPNNFAIQSS